MKEQESLPIYELVREQLQVTPDKPLDISRFPKIMMGDSGMSLTPGLLDYHFAPDPTQGDEWKAVVWVVRAIRSGEIEDWREVERHVEGIRAVAHVDRVLQHLYAPDITPDVKRLFWETARRSCNYEAVKWGIAMGGLLLTDQELDDLLLLARHGEFTLYAASALMSAAAAEASLKRHLVQLLPACYEWATFWLIEYILRDEELVGDANVQRSVLVYGMENTPGMTNEVAFPIAKAVGLGRLFREGAEDKRVCRALIALMDELTRDPESETSLTALDDWPGIYDGYLAMLQQASLDVVSLAAMRTLAIFLKNEEVGWPGKEEALIRMRELMKERFRLDLLREGLKGDARERGSALLFIKGGQVKELLPEVEEAFERNCDTSTLTVLTGFGGREQVERILKKLPDLVDLETRAGIPLKSKRMPDTRFQESINYALIVKAIGALASDEALQTIRRAGRDYHPEVRGAACQAISQLPMALIDDELKAIIRERLNDSAPLVSVAAIKAAENAGIPAVRDEHG